MFNDNDILVCYVDCPICPEFEKCQETEVFELEDDDDDCRANRDDCEVDNNIDYYDHENDLY